jgi:hypothetical protein
MTALPSYEVGLGQDHICCTTHDNVFLLTSNAQLTQTLWIMRYTKLQRFSDHRLGDVYSEGSILVFLESASRQNRGYS